MENFVANSKRELRQYGAMRRRENDIAMYEAMLAGKQKFTDACPDEETAQKKLDKAVTDVENLRVKLQGGVA